jgi:hypothetical protein
MTDEERNQARIQLIEAELAQRAQRGAGAATGMRPDAPAGAPVQAPAAPMETQPPINPLLLEDPSLTRMLGISGTSLAAEEATRRYASPVLAKMGTGGKAAAILAPIGAAAVAGGAAEMATRLATGQDDAFTEAAKNSIPVGIEQGAGAMWGEGLLAIPKLAGKFKLSPLKARIDPDLKSAVDEVNGRLRDTYEKVAGGKLVEARRTWYNPFRRGMDLESELSTAEQTSRLRAAGYDPEMAKQIAVHGAAGLGDLADNTIYRHAQTVLGNIIGAYGPTARHQQTRAAMLQDSIEGLGAVYGKTIDPAYIGQTVRATLSGKLRVGEMARQDAVNAIAHLPSMQPGARGGVEVPWGLSTRTWKKGLDPASPVDGLVGKLPEYADFKRLTETRSALGSMAQDEGLDAGTRARATELSKKLDDSIRRRLPDDAKKIYKTFMDADSDIHRQQLETGFIKGLTESLDKEGAKAYAMNVLQRGDVLDYKRLEKALGPNSPGLNQIKAATMDIIADRATSVDTTGNPTLNPAKGRAALEEYRGLGQEYLQAMFGKETMKDFKRYMDVMDRFNETGRTSQLGRISLALTQAGTLGGALYYKYDEMKPTDAAWIGALLFGPRYVSKAIMSPDSANLITKIAGLASKGEAPHRVLRMSTRLAEQLGTTPEKLLEEIGYNVSPLEKWKRQIREGGPVIPQTGNPMVDMMTNPTAVQTPPKQPRQ